jgi:hypothetical protein
MEASMSSGMKARGLRKLRLGELIAFMGAVCVIVSLVLPWYGGASPGNGASADGKLSAWATFGPAVVLLMISCLIALLLVGATIFERSTAFPVAAAVWSTLFGFFGVIAAIVRLLERPGESSSLQIGAIVALVGAIAILAGSWQSMRDERPQFYEAAEPEQRHF